MESNDPFGADVTLQTDLQPIQTVLQKARQHLAAAGCDTPQLDAELLLAHVLGQERTWLYIHPDSLLKSSQLNRFFDLVARRAHREPVAYLTGHKEFFGLDFLVTPDVLIPRPETELLVELLIADYQSRFYRSLTRQGHGLEPPVHVADIGTGSGCIAVALAKQLAGATIVAVDVSPKALSVARHNAARHGVNDKIIFVQGDLLEPLDQTFDLIVSNPPYVSDTELAATASEVRLHEPHLALAAGPDGLASIRRLLPQAKKRLKPSGMLLVEIGAGQGHPVSGLANSIFSTATVTIMKDLAGLNRMLVVKT